jgi:hypothetical protein
MRLAEKYTNGDAVDIIKNEGLEYAVRSYCAGSDFKDEGTASLWARASIALDDLVDYLRRETGREIDD